MDDSFFKQLSPEEQEEYRNWAWDNYKLGSKINELWHPVVRAECEIINQKKRSQK